jgi:hypothetical protein
MKILPDKYPYNIPYVFASFVSAMFISYAFTDVILEMFFGRPSSTSSIAFFTIPIITAFIFLASFVVGLIVRFVMGRNETTRVMPAKTMRLIYIALFLAALSSSIAGGVSFKIYENAQSPHVIIDNPSVEKTTNIKYRETNQVEAKLLLTIFDDEKSKLSTLAWNDRPIRFRLARDINALALLDNTGKQLAYIDLSDFDYITRVYAVPFSVNSTSRKGLAVLVHLRSTSWQSILLLFNAEASLLYQELLERESMDNVMKTVRDESGNERLWLNASIPVIYRIKRS